ncbi:MAG: precorrin-4 C(11)-methyltransferase [Desulfoplanes sp.]|nr:precorrin-4 C(11)-methyltransferase [Desulfoplanes sp.]
MTPLQPNVYFIGAGPGDPELITVKGQNIIKSADLVLFTGSLVPREVIDAAGPTAEVIDSAPLTLEETHALLVRTVRAGGIAARVHTGDPALFGAVKEQTDLLDRAGIGYEIIPGVTAAFAAAARAKVSFTAPGGTQSLILTRMAGRTPVPDKEAIRYMAAHGSSMAVYLSADKHEELEKELLTAGLSPETTVIIAKMVGHPSEKIIRTRLGDLSRVAREQEIIRQAVFLILPADNQSSERSRLYDPTFAHGYRTGGDQ